MSLQTVEVRVVDAGWDKVRLVLWGKEVVRKGDEEIVKTCCVRWGGSEKVDKVVDARQGRESECEGLGGGGVRDIPW